MKNLRTLLFLMIGLGALAGSVLLVQKIQETRRGAYLDKLNVSVWPDSKTNMQVGEKVIATVKMDAKSFRISAVDLRMAFNTAAFSVESIEIQSGFDKQMMNQVIDGKIVIIAANSNADETKLPTGVFDIAKITFVAKAAGNLNLTLSEYQVPSTQSDTTGDNKMEVNFLPAAYSVGGSSGPVPTGEYFGEADMMVVSDKAVLNVGQSTVVRVVVDSGQIKISGLEFELNYPSDRLEVTNLETSSMFDRPAEKAIIDKNNNKISIVMISSKASSSLPTGRFDVIMFRVKALKSGQATLRLGDNYLATGYNLNSDVKTVKLNLSGINIVLSSTSPSPIMTPILPVLTPTVLPKPTDIPPSGNNPVLNFRMAFGGMDVNGGCADGWPVTVIVWGANGVSKTYANVVMQRDTAIADRAVYKKSLDLVGFDQSSNLAVFIKGPKHLQTKYGVNNQSDFYNRAGGQINLTNDVNSSTWYDFSGYPLLVGDIMKSSGEGQDGLINGLDFARIKALAVTHETWGEGQFRSGDLDGNCQYNSRDVTLLKNSLNEKLDLLY